MMVFPIRVKLANVAAVQRPHDANQAKAALEAESLEAFADRGYFKGEEILACEDAGSTVTLPKPSAAPKNLQLWITPYIWVDMEGESRPVCRICGTVPPVEGSPDAFWTALDS